MFSGSQTTPQRNRLPTSQFFWVGDSYLSILHFLTYTLMITEEFGVTTNQVDIYTGWYNEIISSGLTGDLIWQAGSYLSYGASWDDGYAVYPNSTDYPVMVSAATSLKARG